MPSPTRNSKDGDNNIECEFYTRPAPPLAFLKQVSEKWPTLNFTLRYTLPVSPRVERIVELKAGKVTKCEIDADEYYDAFDDHVNDLQMEMKADVMRAGLSIEAEN